MCIRDRDKVPEPKYKNDDMQVEYIKVETLTDGTPQKDIVAASKRGRSHGKQLNSLQGRQEIRQSRPYRKVQPILFRGRSRPQNKRQRLLLRLQKKLPL